MESWLQQEVDSSDKLYLLHGRKEPVKNKSPSRTVTLALHHYLDAKFKGHRKILDLDPTVEPHSRDREALMERTWKTETYTTLANTASAELRRSHQNMPC